MKNMERRDFLRVLGWGGASASLGACGFTSVESGVENVQSYVNPEPFNVPGVGVYYASTCTQCEARCGIVGRVRDGRVLKLEGNVESDLSGGKLCGLGQASVQHHYNPDRLREPLLREGGEWKPVTMARALEVLRERTSGAKEGRLAVVTGPVGGHLKVLVRNTVDAFGPGLHFAYDPLATRVNHVAAEQVLGSAAPRLSIADARLIVSFGADFLDTWSSPVHFAGQYARFRRGNEGHGRGVLVQIEPRMTLTGANADRWIAIRPGTEGILALGLARALLAKGGAAAAAAPAQLAAAAAPFDKARVLAETGVTEEAFERLLRLLQERSPSLVLSGPSAEGHAHGYSNAQAILALNWVLGNVGKTIHPAAKLPFPQIEAEPGDTAAIARFASAAAAGKFDAAIFLGVNPVFTAPSGLKVREALAKVPFKVCLAQYRDETANEADLVIPVDSALEDWGTHVAFQQGEEVQLTLQQPLMERLYPNGTRSSGDILLELLRHRRPDEYKAFPDSYSYLRAALVRARAAFPGNEGRTDEDFWTQALSHGVLKVHTEEAKAPAHAPAVEIDLAGVHDSAEAGHPLHLVPAVRAALRDGRHANLPWLQEVPDPLTTIVWDSWVEIHPTTAARLGISEGDMVEVSSASGSVRAQAYLFPGLHPDVIGVPLGQGHEKMGRYADGRGVNPFHMLDAVMDRKTGELATHATRVKISRTGERVRVVKDEGWKSGVVKTQAGRKLVVTLAADKARLSEES
jgi:anaerobic selenocysteine-containing dehydrogenase